MIITFSERKFKFFHAKTYQIYETDFITELRNFDNNVFN